MIRLSPRQQQVAACIDEGLDYKHVAARLTMSKGTVREHVATIAAKIRKSGWRDSEHDDGLEPKLVVFLWMRWRRWTRASRELSAAD